jgi:hypothetical protein
VAQTEVVQMADSLLLNVEAEWSLKTHRDLRLQIERLSDSLTLCEAASRLTQKVFRPEGIILVPQSYLWSELDPILTLAGPRRI